MAHRCKTGRSVRPPASTTPARCPNPAAGFCWRADWRCWLRCADASVPRSLAWRRSAGVNLTAATPIIWSSCSGYCKSDWFRPEDCGRSRTTKSPKALIPKGFWTSSDFREAMDGGLGRNRTTDTRIFKRLSWTVKGGQPRHPVTHAVQLAPGGSLSEATHWLRRVRTRATERCAGFREPSVALRPVKPPRPPLARLLSVQVLGFLLQIGDADRDRFLGALCLSFGPSTERFESARSCGPITTTPGS